ncbi:MAG: hypothetical protein ACLURV_05955 [Gallintestinimicrobium sp.]
MAKEDTAIAPAVNRFCRILWNGLSPPTPAGNGRGYEEVGKSDIRSLLR